MSKLFKRILYKIYDLKHKYYIRRDIRKGYIAPDGQPLKCFKCGAKNWKNIMNIIWMEDIEKSIVLDVKNVNNL